MLGPRAQREHPTVGFLDCIQRVGRGLYIASNARSTYARLLAGSLSLTFFVYVLVNAGMVSGLLPVVGVPLPFISYGGSSVLTTAISVGLLLNVSMRRFMLD